MSKTIDNFLSAAVELRVVGFPWDQVAERLKRRPQTCRNWPVKFKAQWDELFRAAEERRFLECSKEAQTRITNLMRNADPKWQAKGCELWGKFGRANYGKGGSMVTEEPPKDARPPHPNDKLFAELRECGDAARGRTDKRPAREGKPPATDDEFAAEWTAETEAATKPYVWPEYDCDGDPTGPEEPDDEDDPMGLQPWTPERAERERAAMEEAARKILEQRAQAGSGTGGQAVLGMFILAAALVVSRPVQPIDRGAEPAYGWPGPAVGREGRWVYVEAEVGDRAPEWPRRVRTSSSLSPASGERAGVRGQASAGSLASDTTRSALPPSPLPLSPRSGGRWVPLSSVVVRDSRDFGGQRGKPNLGTGTASPHVPRRRSRQPSHAALERESGDFGNEGHVLQLVPFCPSADAACQRRATHPFRTKFSVQSEQPSDRFQEVSAPAPLPGRLAESRDRSVQELVLVQPEGHFDLLSLLLGQLAIESDQERVEHLAPPGLELLRQPGDHLPVLPPAPVVDEPPALFLDDPLGPLDVGPAPGQRLLADALQVVDVKDERRLPVVDRRVEVARDRDVLDDNRPPGPAVTDGREALFRDHGLGRPGRAEDDVRLDERIVQPVPPDGLPTALRGHGIGLLGAAVGDHDLPRPESAQVLESEPAHLAGANDQDRLVVEMVEHLTHIIDRDTGHGSVPLRDPGFRADALGRLLGVLQASVERRPGRAESQPGLKGRLHLAGDLTLPEDQAVEACGHPEQVADPVAVSSGDQMRPKRPRVDAMELAQELREQPGVRQFSVGRSGQVHLHAVASAEDDGLAPVAGREVGGRGVALVVGERDPLAQGHVRTAEAHADGDEVHLVPSPANGCAATSVTSMRPNAASVSRARRRGGKWAP